MDTFGVQCSVRALPRADQIIYLEGFTTSVWKSTMYERAVNLAEGENDLACQGLTFVLPDGAALLLVSSFNITEDSQMLSPLLAGRAPPF